MAETLATMAQCEAASVDAFESLHADLARLGASRSLLRAVSAARNDEIRHARVVGKMAERFGARLPRKQAGGTGSRSLQDLAVENAEEGCVRETFGAALASVQASRARDPDIRRMMIAIAKDEGKHAALAWRIADWLETRMEPEERLCVKNARLAAMAALERELSGQDQENERLGLPDRRGQLAALEAMREAIETGDLKQRPSAASPTQAATLSAGRRARGGAGGAAADAGPTGHRSSVMINRFRRAARTWAELRMGPLSPLDDAIPELRSPHDGPSEEGERGPTFAEREGFEPSVPLRVHMISKRDGNRPDPREIEKRSSIHDPSKPEIEGLRTDLGQSRGNPRASALAGLYRHAAALVDAGDIAGARALHEAIGRLLGDERAIRADVVDLNEKRRP